METARLERENRVFERWKTRLNHYRDRPLGNEEVTYAEVLLRNTQGMGASHALQVRESRTRVEEMVVTMGLGLFELLQRF